MHVDIALEKALEEIFQKRGVFYDPEVVDACVRIFSKNQFKLERILEQPGL